MPPHHDGPAFPCGRQRFEKIRSPGVPEGVGRPEHLETHPLAGHRLQGSLDGVRAFGFHAAGVAYRLAYIVDADRCLVFLIGPHEGFYAQAARRF